MLLGEFVQSLPRGKRTAFREALAKAHGKSVSLVRKWENSPPPKDWDEDKRKKSSRRHPVDKASIEITEQLTQKRVTRADLRPECWEAADEC